MTWNVSCKVVKVDEENPIRYYAFNAQSLNKNVFQKKGGFYFRQCFYASWLEDSCTQMSKLDIKMGEVYVKMQRSKSSYDICKVAKTQAFKQLKGSEFVKPDE